MSRTPLPDLILYTGASCELCAETRVLLDDLLDARRASGLAAPTVVERDIAADPSWEQAFFASIPVVELGGRRLELATSAARLRRLLADVLDA
jgi:hypothetical protein